MAVGDLYRLQIRYYAGGQYCVSKLLYRVQNQVDANESMPGRLNELFRANVINTTWQGLAAIDVFCVQLYSRRVWPTFLPPNALTFESVNVNVTNVTPPCAPICLTIYAAAPGRENRNRVYLSIAGEFHTAQGRLTEVGFNLAVALAESLFSFPSPPNPAENQFTLRVEQADIGASPEAIQIRTNPELRVMRSRIRKPAITF